MQGSECARNAGRRGPQRGLPPRHARDHALLADPAGRISSNTPAPPHSVRSPGVKSSDRAELQRPSATTGAGRPTATTASTFGQHTYRTSYYRSIRGIFLTEGFQATIRLPEVPPRPFLAVRLLSSAPVQAG